MGPSWIWARLDWVTAQVGLEPGAGGRGPGLVPCGASLEPSSARRRRASPRRSGSAGIRPAPPTAAPQARPRSRGGDRGVGERGRRAGGLRGCGGLARDRLLRGRHAEAGRLRYDCFRYRGGVPLGSGAIESTIRRVINLRLKGDEPVLGGGECGGGDPACRRGALQGRWEERLDRTQVKPWPRTGGPTGIGSRRNAWRS